ncbi:hypothetical protein NIES4071_04570 [Calothrix sp. NIES-4071]|nr:hypothetical protein NIES4071_04570 [Calothrix sp. NIES-4071]BAZ54803.1 hypothetical protein NIES4105_04560 [Calothrix sp. NIES-4105]
MTLKNSISLGIVTIPLAAILFLGFAERALSAELGVASGYNVFVLGVQQQETVQL